MNNLAQMIREAKPIEIEKSHWMVNLSIASTEKRNSQQIELRKRISKEEIIASIDTSTSSGVNLRNAIKDRGLLDEVNFIDYKKSILYHRWITNTILFNFSALDLND